jgi:hypothetical protein
MSTPGKAGPEQLPDGPGIAVLVIPMTGGVRPPTGDTAAMLAWLSRHGAPCTGEVLTRLERDAWTLALPDAAASHRASWPAPAWPASSRRAPQLGPSRGRVDGPMRWTPADRPTDTTSVPVTEPPGAHGA